MINLGLSMINVNDNRKNSGINTKCEFCENVDTSEHLFECPILRTLKQEEMKAKNLETVHNMLEL